MGTAICLPEQLLVIDEGLKYPQTLTSGTQRHKLG